MGRFWVRSADGEIEAFRMYRRHYSVRNPTPKIRQFVGPGEKLVLIGFMCAALFAWRKFLDDSGQDGVNCAVFRNESPNLSSAMILEAEEWAWDRWPGQRLYTTVNPEKVRSSNPGYCFLKAGWVRCGRTKRGLIVMEKTP